MAGLAKRAEIEDELSALTQRGQMAPKGGRWHDFLRFVDCSRISDLLRLEPSLAEFCREDMREDGSGASRLTVDSLVSWLVARALDTTVSQAVAELSEYAASATFPIRFLMGVRGVSVVGDFGLGAGVVLSAGNTDFDKLSGSTPPPYSAVLSALVQFPKLTRSSDLNAPPTVDRRADAARAGARERVNVARLCVAVTLDTRVIEAARASRQLDSVPSAAGHGGSSEPYIPPISSVSVDANAAKQIRDFHERLLALPSSLRDRLIIALHRWHACKLKVASPDLFIDLGIGFECVFLPEESSELKQRLTVRAARLLAASTVEARKEMAGLIALLYDARSRAVHRGQLLTKIKNSPAHDVYHLGVIGEHLLRRAILAMVARGRDDWDDLVFG